MVDASSLFFVYEFFIAYFPSASMLFEGPYSLAIWGGMALLTIAVAFLLKHSSNRAAGVIRAFSLVIAVISCFFFAAMLVLYCKGDIDDWIARTLPIEPEDFYVYAGLAASGLLAVVCACVSLTKTRVPHNDSTLNARQKLQAVAVFSALFCIGLAIWYGAPEVFGPLVLILIFTAEFTSILFWFYDPIILFVSKLFPRNPHAPLKPTPGKANRFAVLGCAHNEEAVVGHLVDSLFAMDYPKGRYDIFVICDNCTDKTAQIVKGRGAIAMERTDDVDKGKGYALKWMFGILEEMRLAGDVYDAYIVLDADNLVNEQYLSEINRHLNQGHEIMQSYLGCKNPSDTWISKCYSMAYWLSNATYQEAHSNVNLSAQMGGTGMVLRPDMLNKLAWESDSLTEDLVLTAKYVLREDRACHWVHTARLYDEKPLQLKQSIKQRTRWMQGHMDAMIQYAPRLLLSSMRNLSFKQLDMAFYLTRPFFNLMAFIFYLVRFVAMFAFPGSLASVSLIMNFQSATILVLAYIMIQVYILNTENYLRYALWIPLQYAFTYTWYPPIFRGLLKFRERHWVSTVHGRSLTIGDIREDVILTDAKRRLAGLDNLHLLPLGQILLKAAVINGFQLQKAIDIQKRTGGFLGNILVETHALSEETLNAYVSIQQVMRETVEEDASQLQRLQLGQILLDGNVVTEGQLGQALEFQKEQGGLLGENLVALRLISPDLLNIFLEVQELIGANYINNAKAHDLIKDMTLGKASGGKGLEGILVSSGLVSNQQVEAARELQEGEGGSLDEALIGLGYISDGALRAIQGMGGAGLGKGGDA